MPIDRRAFLARSGSCAAHLALAASYMPLLARAAWAQTNSGSVVAREPFGNLEKVADGVWAIISTPLSGDRTTLSNGGIIAGRSAVLAIEGFQTPIGAQWLAGKAREGKLQPHEFQGGTASLSNLGMFGIKQFEAVINPPQGMILAVGAGEQRPYIVDGALGVATVMSATGSFDHRAIDGADGAELMQAFKQIVENPLALVA